MKKLSVIGCGRWGPNHIRNFSSLPGSKVVAAVETDQERREQIANMFPSLTVHADCCAVLEDTTIDAVVVATHAKSHYRLVHDALLAGKHVLCEKPLCETGEQGEKLVRLAEQCNRVLMTGHVFLFNAGIIKLKELVQTEIGSLYYLAAKRTNLGPIRSDVNSAYDLAAHDISIFNWLVGAEPKTVSATGSAFLQPGIEDVVFIALTYPGGVMANIHASWLDPNKVRTIAAVGSSKMVTWDDLHLTAPIAIFDKGAAANGSLTSYDEHLRISMWDGDVRLPKVHIEEPLKVQSRYFLEAIEKGHSERSDGRFGLGVVRVLEAISESLRQRGAPVEVSP